MKVCLGLLALGFYAIHAGNCIRLSQAEEALWACHVATASIAFGLFFQSRTCVAVGGCCLTVGTPLWLIEVTLGKEVLSTSFLTHVGGLIVAWLGLYLLRAPRAMWWKGVLGLMALQQVCRWWTPADANVNAAFAVYPRFEPLFSSYTWYLAALLVVAITVFWTLEQLFRRLFPEPQA